MEGVPICGPDPSESHLLVMLGLCKQSQLHLASILQIYVLKIFHMCLYVNAARFSQPQLLF